jgi:hypothetical protein
MIRFKATLLKPESPPRATWSFLRVPKVASAKLSSRGQVAVEGTINGQAFKAVFEPDGEGSHWLKVGAALRKKVQAEVGGQVSLEIAQAAEAPEPMVPPELRKALAATPAAKAQWDGLKPAQRQDWILWITSAKRAETSTRRIATACDMLASGKRRVCCFDRSGIYSKSLSAPKAAS